MINTKLVNLLRTFSDSEFKEYEKMADSPFFNKGRNYLPLLKQLKKFHPKFDDEKMTGEYLFSKAYPGKKFNRQALWNMTSALLDIAEELLLHQSLKKNKFIRTRQIGHELYNRKLNDYYAKKIDEMELLLEHSQLGDEYFLLRKLLESDRKEYLGAVEQLHSFVHDDKEGEFVIHFSLWSILRVLNDMNVHNYTYNTNYDFSLTREFTKNLQLEKIILYLKEKEYKYTWLFEMYHCLIMITSINDAEKYFLKLKGLFEANYGKFNTQARYNWMACLINYCSFKRDNKTRRLLFELHKFELKEGLLLHGKYLSKSHFFQIIKNSLSIGETGWVKKFIEDYEPRLHPSYKKQSIAIALGLLYFALKDYNKVFDILGKTRFTQAKDKLTVKLIYLRVYYELNEIEPLLSFVDSTMHFLNNTANLNKELSVNAKECLRLVKKLTLMKDDNTDDTLFDIRKSISENKNLALSEWLTEKVEEIELIKK